MEETLGKRIASHRKRLGMTQDALAEQLGVTAQAVSKWENDQSCPDITTLPKLAGIFGATTDALLGIAPQEETPALPTIPASAYQEEESEGIHLENGTWELKWDGGKRSNLGFALWFVLLGIYLSAGAILNRELYWLSAVCFSGLTVFGLFGLFPRFSLFRFGCLLFGCYYLLTGAGVLKLSIHPRLVFPLLLIIVGLHLFFKSLRKDDPPYFCITHNGKQLGKRTSSCTYDHEDFSCSTCFGEQHYLITLPRLSGGTANLSFGELEVDLRSCEVIADGCQLELESAFGKLTLIVPKTCRVEPSVSTSFAAFNIKGDPDPNATDTIYVNGSAAFGEISIKYL